MSEWWNKWKDRLGLGSHAAEDAHDPVAGRAEAPPANPTCTRTRRGDNYVAIAFWLVKDEDDYPPDEVEFLWCELLPNGHHYRIDNVPFYAKGVAVNDVIKTQKGAERRYFTGVVKTGGHSTIRVIFFDKSRIAEVRARMQEWGCPGEEGPVDILYAFDVRPTVALEPIKEYCLWEGERSEAWTFQEACLGQ